MKLSEEKRREIPLGSYCYGYVPTSQSGFKSLSDVEKYLKEKYSDPFCKEIFEEHDNLLIRKFCPFWQSTDFGFVRCRFLSRIALKIPTDEEIENQAIQHFGSREKMESEVNGFLLGDAVKECNNNVDGDDFSFLD